MRSVIRLSLLLWLSLFAAMPMNGQSAASMYDQGVSLYKKGNYQGAIKALNESMILNKSATNKKKCQALINKCNRALNKKKSDTPKSKPSAESLTVRTNRLLFDGVASDAEVVGVNATDAWSIRLENDDDQYWCEIRKSDDQTSLVVKTKPSTLTVSRQARINVFLEKNPAKKADISVVQKRGKAVQIKVSDEDIRKIDRAGEEKVITVDCKSDTVYADGRNWTVEKSPTWVSFLSTKKSRKSRVGIQLNELSLEFAPNPTKEERVGYIVLRSQEAECHIKLTQQKGNRKTGAK